VSQETNKNDATRHFEKQIAHKSMHFIFRNAHQVLLLCKRLGPNTFQYFIMQKYNFQKILEKKDTYHNSIITNLKFQTQAKNIIFQKSSDKNRPIIIIT
jgi:hypothetical protein